LLEKNIFTILSEFEGTVGLYFEDLSTGKKICINPETRFSAASTIKIPLVALLLIQAKQGIINLNDQVEMDEVNRIGGSGVIKELDNNYKPTVMDLAKLTIILSDNAATNQLIDLVGGADKVNKFCNDIGMLNTKLQRKMMDLKSLELGRDNFTTPNDMGKLLTLLANGEMYSKEVSNMLVDIMKAQQLNQKLPYLIPALEPDDPAVYSTVVEEGTVIVAHKTGELWKAQHDVGIFILPNNRRYVLAIYTSDLYSDNDGVKIIANLSKVVYDGMKDA
jgi:beta-lactamase class A